jgi:hypothetical protein
VEGARALRRAATPGQGRAAGAVGRAGALAFVALSVLGLAWALANPLLAEPDEPAQVLKAEAVVRGELLGRPARPGEPVIAPVGLSTDPTLLVRVPGVLADVNTLPDCYFFTARVPASCMAPIAGPAHDVEVPTYVARYPPLYYLVVGLPTLATPGAPGIYAMRVLSWLWCAALLSGAFAVAWRRSRLSAFGVVAAVTPATAYYGAAVNPNGLEIAAAVAAWMVGLDLVRPLDAPVGRPPPVGRVVGFALAAGTLVVTRGLSPAWLVGIAVVLSLVALPGRVPVLVRARSVRRCAGILALITVAALAWILVVRTLSELSLPVRRGTPLVVVARLALQATGRYLLEMVGPLTWNGPLVDPLTSVLLAAASSLLVLGALWVAPGRLRLGLVLVLVATFAVPVAADLVGAYHYGLIWQGRYTMPVAVGVVVLAADALGEAARRAGALHGGPLPRGGRVGAFAERLLPALLVSWWLAGVVELLWVLHRYVAGSSSPLIDVLSGPWRPPLGPLVLLGLAAAGGALLAVGVLVLRRDGVGDSPPIGGAGGTAEVAAAGLFGCDDASVAGRPHVRATGEC